MTVMNSAVANRPLELHHRVGSEWVDGPGGVTEDQNPARPDETIALAPVGDRSTAEQALRAAREALPGWARTPAPARGEILFRAAELLAGRAESIGRELSREEGKTLTEAIGETQRAATILRYFGSQTLQAEGEIYASATPGTRIWSLRQPIGVVAIITPWNFPIAIPAWKLAPALAYGNTVVFKPASATPVSAFRLIEALVDAGVPPGVVNLVFAPGPTAEDAWLGTGGVDAVSFTGSRATGQRIRRRGSAAGIKLQLELGGKNAVVVAADADLEKAADAIVRGAFASAGQKCTATSRVIAMREIIGPLEERVADRVQRLVPGDPLEPSTTLGPVIDRAARDRIADLVDRTVRSGGRIIARRDVPGQGWFAPAVVLGHLRADQSIAREEAFGPVLGIFPVSDLDDALRLHDRVAYGLSASIFTRDLATAQRFVSTARAGIIHVNGDTTGAEPHVPFGGMKASSSGSREQGNAASEFYTQLKTIYWDGTAAAGLFDAAHQTWSNHRKRGRRTDAD